VFVVEVGIARNSEKRRSGVFGVNALLRLDLHNERERFKPQGAGINAFSVLRDPGHELNFVTGRQRKRKLLLSCHRHHLLPAGGFSRGCVEPAIVGGA
jgi:hypothetical protein